jgi:Flp pilus assembly protein TadG
VLNNRRNSEICGPRSKRAFSARRGAVAVEFALTASLLFLILFASVEFMRVNTIVNTTENAAYEGARAGVVPGATSTQVETAATSLLSAIGIRNATVTVQPTTISATSPDVTVTIGVPLDSNSLIAPRFFLGDTLTKSCKLSREVPNAQ